MKMQSREAPPAETASAPPAAPVLRPATGGASDAWQLRMFEVSLKKQQKLAMLLELLGPLNHHRCLLITHGDNPGSLNYHLRAAGGSWSWAELEPDGIPQVEALLGETVHAATPGALPFEDEVFDRVVVIDVHEHLTEVTTLNGEIARILAPEGVAIVTTPSGDPKLRLAAIKRWIGMDNAAYGHVVQGYRTEELESMMRDAGLVPVGRGAYSRFFTEFAELVINFGYVKVLSPRRAGQAPAGEIAPRTADGLRSVGGAFRVYRTIFPLVRAFSALDILVPGADGYAVAVVACKPAPPGSVDRQCGAA
jgi:SAM-dependent methyltransferase